MMSWLNRMVNQFHWRFIGNMVGKVLLTISALMLLPLIVDLIYQEQTYLYFLYAIGIGIVIGFPLSHLNFKNHSYFSRDGFASVALAWVAASLLGCLPFYFSGVIPHFVDAVFETVSGFTTTGSSILTDLSPLSHALLFWRSFTHWIGGMGVLVFILALVPHANDRMMVVMRAEAPGTCYW